MRITILFFALFSLSCAPTNDLATITVAYNPKAIRSVDIEVFATDNQLVGGARAAGYGAYTTGSPYIAYELIVPIVSTPLFTEVVVRSIVSYENALCFFEDDGFLEITLPDGYALTEYTEESQGYDRCKWEINLSP